MDVRLALANAGVEIAHSTGEARAADVIAPPAMSLASDRPFGTIVHCMSRYEFRVNWRNWALPV